MKFQNMEVFVGNVKLGVVVEVVGGEITKQGFHHIVGFGTNPFGENILILKRDGEERAVHPSNCSWLRPSLEGENDER